MKNIYTYLAILALGLTGCNDDSENKAGNYNSGQADFSSYVAVGTSHTAGTMDGTISRVGQSYSFPNILAQQFSLAGGGEFTQPSYEEDVNNLGGVLNNGQTIPNEVSPDNLPVRLIIDAGAGGPEFIAGISTINITSGSLQARAYNNMGVPNMKSYEMLKPGLGNIANLSDFTPSYDKSNPYFTRHATSPDATVMGDAMSKNPTFFTSWIGCDDVLPYALSGGKEYISITNSEVFDKAYSDIINALTYKGAKGVVATVPYITSIPYFTTVPYNPLTAVVIGNGDEAAGIAEIAEINAGLYGDLVEVLGVLGEGSRIQLLNPNIANPLMIRDVSLRSLKNEIGHELALRGYSTSQAWAIGSRFEQVRQATSADLIMLPALSSIGEQIYMWESADRRLGINEPLHEMYVLTAAQVQKTKIAIDKFNATIRSIAASKNLAVADMNETFKQMQSHDGNMYNIGYFNMGGLDKALFSLDGIHPNARGNAYITNEIIKVINSHYGAKLPLVEVSRYPGATILPSN